MNTTVRRWRTAAVAVAATLIPIGGLAVAGGVAGASTCSPTTGAASCTVSGTATITGGSLQVQAPATLSWAATLNGTAQSVNDAAVIEPVDATGSGSGWDLEVTSTQFTTGTDTLPTSALTVNGSASNQTSTTAPVASCVSTCTLPTSTTAPVTYPLTVPAASTAPTAVALYTADAATGEGAVDLASDWWLTIPATANAGTYTNTITLSIVSGP